MTAPILTTFALLDDIGVTAPDPVDNSGHRPFCWCHNHADADGVFHWTSELPALRFPLEETP